MRLKDFEGKTISHFIAEEDRLFIFFSNEPDRPSLCVIAGDNNEVRIVGAKYYEVKRTERLETLLHP